MMFEAPNGRHNRVQEHRTLERRVNTWFVATFVGSVTAIFDTRRDNVTSRVYVICLI
jgi:hypothetical protein